MTFWCDKTHKRENFVPGKIIQPEVVLKPFLNFRSKAINTTDVIDFGLKKITPELIGAYYQLKA